MKHFENKILIGKNCGNVNRTCDELTKINKLDGLEYDVQKLKKLREKCEEVVGHELNGLF